MTRWTGSYDSRDLDSAQAPGRRGLRWNLLSGGPYSNALTARIAALTLPP